MEEDKIIERPRQTLSFIEQLQNQIQLCREAMSDYTSPLTPKVEALECLLWAKLLKNEEYQNKMKELNQQLKKKREIIKSENPNSPEWQQEEKISPYVRNRAKQQFKAIMVFIDKQELMPMGDK